VDSELSRRNAKTITTNIKQKVDSRTLFVLR
jgi:hypothetical protein